MLLRSGEEPPRTPDLDPIADGPRLGSSAERSKGLEWLLVTGAPRSGTSLLRTLLVEHPQVALLQEYGLTEFVGRLDAIVSRQPAKTEDWDRDVGAGADAFGRAQAFYRERPGRDRTRGGGDPQPAHFHDLAMGLFRGMFPRKSDISVVGDKMPIAGENWEDIPALVRRLPEFRIVAIVRAPDQTIRSSLVRREATRRGIDDWPIRTVQEAMRQWLTAWRTIVALVEHHPSRVLVLKYEDLCDAPQVETRRITAWMDLPEHAVETPIASLGADVTVHSPEEQAAIRRLTQPLSDAWRERTADQLLADFAGYDPPYMVGDDIRLCEEDAARFLRHGFSFCEEWGRWTEGHHASIVIEHGVMRGMILVELHVAKSHQGRSGCDVVIRSGWGEPKLFTLPTGPSRIAFIVRAEEAEDRGTCSIEIDILDPKHPDAPPADSRALGILLATMRLSQVPTRE